MQTIVSAETGTARKPRLRVNLLEDLNGPLTIQDACVVVEATFDKLVVCEQPCLFVFEFDSEDATKHTQKTLSMYSEFN